MLSGEGRVEIEQFARLVVEYLESGTVGIGVKIEVPMQFGVLDE
jgi:hypothetical protein